MINIYGKITFLCLVLWSLIFHAEAMDIQVQQAEVGTLVRSIARSGGLELIGDDTLSGTVSLRLKNVTPIEALQAIGKVKKFTVMVEGNKLFVMGNAKEEFGFEPLVMKPRYMKAQDLAQVLSAIVPIERLKVHEATEEVLLYGQAKEHYEARKVLEELDKAPKQVRLSAKVIALQSSSLKELGINWSWLPFTGHGKDNTNSHGAIHFGHAPNGEPFSFYYQAKLEALESKGKAVLIAKPNMLAMNGEEAHILIGDRIPVVAESYTDGRTTTSVRYEESGIRLTYKPHIEESGYIDATVRAEISTPTLVSELKAYRITTREAKTRVRLKEGEVLVIGGLMDNRQEGVKKKIPILGNIPLLGKLFQSSRKLKEEVEIIILLEAHICKAEENYLEEEHTLREKDKLSML